MTGLNRPLYYPYPARSRPAYFSASAMNNPVLHDMVPVSLVLLSCQINFFITERSGVEAGDAGDVAAYRSKFEKNLS